MSEAVSASVKIPEIKKGNKVSQVQKCNFCRQVSSPVEQILFLQRTIGNQAVQRLMRSGALQAKLRIGAPGDVYEQEADRVAERVMRMADPASIPQSPANSRSEGLSIQNTCRDPENDIQRKVEDVEEEGIVHMKNGSQPRAAGSQQGVPPIVHEVLSLQGLPLDPATRAYMEPRFGHDFSRVTVHSGVAAEQSAKEVNANAYTVGHNIVFGAGQFAPGTHEGRRLIAHELTHIVQQSRADRNSFGQSTENSDLSTIPPLIQRKKASSPPIKKSSSASTKKQREFFIHRLTPTLAYVVSQYDNLASKTEGLAVLYHNAWEHHTKVLIKADANERIVGELILDSALAFIPGGIGGLTGKWMGGIKGSSELANAFISDGIKDLVKITLRRQISKVITESEGFKDTPQIRHAGPAYKAIGDDPFTWRGTAMKNVLAEKSFVEATVTDWGVWATNDVNSKFIYDWDPYVFVREVIRIEKTAPENIPEPTEQEALLFEKGLWKGWIDNYRYYLVDLSGHGVAIGDRAPAEIDAVGGLPAYLAGQKIRERITALAAELGEDGDTWLKQWGIESMEKLKAEKDKRNKGTFGATLKRGLEWIFGVDKGQ